MHLGLPLCAHSSQPHYAGSNHHAPPPALALLRWWHLAYCQVGGLSKAPQFTPRAAPQATTNQHNQAIHKVNTESTLHCAGSVRKSTVTTELPYTCFVTRIKQSSILVPAKTPNSMDVKIEETHAIVQCLLWCPAVWGKSSRAKYHVVVAALTCCFSCLSCAAMHIVK